MGWANCGTDEDGRPIGYIFDAVCDHPECDAKIDRGLAYCCGEMHGGEEIYDEESTTFVKTCGRYFCGDHRVWAEGFSFGQRRSLEVCMACAKDIAKHLAK